MSYIFEGDSQDAMRNRFTVINGPGIAYNGVTSVTFSNESTTEPVSLQDAKDWCRIDNADDDNLITALIKGSRMICEKYANISFITRTVTAIIQNGLGKMNLPYGPVTGAITFFNDDGTPATDYTLKTPSSDDMMAVYTAGYSPLPEDLRTAMLNQIAWMYENRGDAAVAGKLSEQAKLILNIYRNIS